MKQLTAIFDVGKTNKKFYLLDRDFHVELEKSESIPVIEDDDGFPCDDIHGIIHWISGIMTDVFMDYGSDIHALNFSAYGASLVYIGKNGEILAPLYNYLRPYPEELLHEFYRQYGPVEKFTLETSSPQLAMLNSGLQLFWLKKSKQKIFNKTNFALHLPQFLSFYFTKQPVSDYTSIGCHTALWNYSEFTYHSWVGKERILEKLAPIVKGSHCFLATKNNETLQVGAGIHDSSSALEPYLQFEQEPFILLSTGTWSIALNPFNRTPLTSFELREDCLQYLSSEGQPIKASRLHLGDMYSKESKRLAEYFHKPPEYHRQIHFDPAIVKELKTLFEWRSCSVPDKPSTLLLQSHLDEFNNYEKAYHFLMMRLISHQHYSIKLVEKGSTVNNILVDGGFSRSDVFLNLLASSFSEMKIFGLQNPLGSALGAAMLVSGATQKESARTKPYILQECKSVISWNLGT